MRTDVPDSSDTVLSVKMPTVTLGVMVTDGDSQPRFERIKPNERAEGVLASRTLAVSSRY